MSFEYHFVPYSNVDNCKLSIVSLCFEEKISLYANEINSSDSFANRNYHFIGDVRSHWPEDFIVCLEKEQCYLCFNSATGEQRADIMNILTYCLHSAGLFGSFEEL